jgi:hypothetical protein
MDVILQPNIQEVVIQKSTQIQEAKTSQNFVLDSFRRFGVRSRHKGKASGAEPPN